MNEKLNKKSSRMCVFFKKICPSIIAVLLFYSQPGASVLSGHGYYNSVAQNYQQNAYSNIAPYNYMQGNVCILLCVNICHQSLLCNLSDMSIIQIQ